MHASKARQPRFACTSRKPPLPENRRDINGSAAMPSGYFRNRIYSNRAPGAHLKIALPDGIAAAANCDLVGSGCHHQRGRSAAGVRAIYLDFRAGCCGCNRDGCAPAIRLGGCREGRNRRVARSRRRSVTTCSWSVKVSKIMPLFRFTSLPFIKRKTGAAGQNTTAAPAVIMPVRVAWLSPLFLFTV